MATISFKTRGNNIFLQFSYGRSNLLRYSLGIKVEDPKNLFKEEHDSHETLHGEKHKNSINKKLARYYSEIREYYDELETLGEEINNDILREKLKQSRQGTEIGSNTAVKRDFLSLYEYYIEALDSGEIRKRGKKLGKDTVRGYRSTLKVMTEYSKDIRPIIFSTLSIRDYNLLLKYFEERGFTKNYCGTHISRLKSFLSYAIKHFDVNAPKYSPSDFTKISEQIDNIYLNNDELYKIYELDLTSFGEKYIDARDTFLIGAYTGLRISDYKKLSNNQIIEHNGVKMFKLKTKKTDTEVFIPISQIVETIISKRGGIPSFSNEQYLNRLIKEIGELAGIDEKVSITKTSGGKRTTSTHMKFDLISSHTARRSFCTNAYLGGLDTIAIMAISGHTSEKTFLNYIKVTPQQHAERIANHPYFSGLTTR